MSYIIIHTWSKPNSHEIYNSVKGTTKYATELEAKEALKKMHENIRKNELATGICWYRKNDGFMYIQQSRTVAGYSVSWVTLEIKYLLN